LYPLWLWSQRTKSALDEGVEDPAGQKAAEQTSGDARR
jgi:hypothetical protein